jgi:hypothetical protein
VRFEGAVTVDGSHAPGVDLVKQRDGVRWIYDVQLGRGGEDPLNRGQGRPGGTPPEPPIPSPPRDSNVGSPTPDGNGLTPKVARSAG